VRGSPKIKYLLKSWNWLSNFLMAHKLSKSLR